jgi:hypothetical protein
LIRELLLDRFKQSALNDRWLLARQDVALISDLTDIESEAKDVVGASSAIAGREAGDIARMGTGCPPSRDAICSASVTVPEMISSSQRLPYAMVLTSRRRRSGRSGRTSFRDEPWATGFVGIFWMAAFAREWRGGDRRRVRYGLAV